MTDISNLPKPVELAFVKIDPTNLDACKLPIVIFHGIFSNKDNWTKLGKEIAEKTNRVVYCFDVRDHGDSPFTNEFVTKAMISDMVHFMNQHKIEKALMLGHSLGGLIFCRLATLFPHLVEKLILVDIHPKKKMTQEGKPNIVQMFAQMLKKTMEKVKAEKMDLETAKTYLDEMLKPHIKDDTNRRGYLDKLTIRDGEISWRFNLDALINFLEMARTLDDVIPDFKGPALEVYGGISQFFTKDDYESTLELLPNCKFEVIEEADHILPSTHPKEFIEKVVPFINE